MKHPERIKDYLEHIVEAIEMATNYLAPLETLDELRASRQIQDAVVRNIEILGEAVTHIHRMAPDFLLQHPQIPWIQMRGMRNLVIHEYFSLDLRMIWTTVKNDLPQLKQEIDRLLVE